MRAQSIETSMPIGLMFNDNSNMKLGRKSIISPICYLESKSRKCVVRGILLLRVDLYLWLHHCVIPLVNWLKRI